MDRYRLAPVRDARDRDERIRRGDLAAAVGAASATERDVGAAAERVELARTAIDQAREASVRTARDVVQREQFLGRLRRDLEARLVEHERAIAAHRGTLDQLDAARSRLARARAERQVIERHFERWRTERARTADRRSD